VFGGKSARKVLRARASAQSRPVVVQFLQTAQSIFVTKTVAFISILVQTSDLQLRHPNTDNLPRCRTEHAAKPPKWIDRHIDTHKAHPAPQPTPHTQTNQVSLTQNSCSSIQTHTHTTHTHTPFTETAIVQDTNTLCSVQSQSPDHGLMTLLSQTHKHPRTSQPTRGPRSETLALPAQLPCLL
jgi:hypothetical protein